MAVVVCRRHRGGHNGPLIDAMLGGMVILVLPSFAVSASIAVMACRRRNRCMDDSPSP